MGQLQLNENGETGCCKRFNPGPWEDKEIVWESKSFVKDTVTCFLHIPLNMGSKVIKNMKLMESAGAENSEQIMLADEISPWRSDIYIAADKDVPDATMVALSGTFLTRVFEGPFRNVPKWATEMNNWVKSLNKEAKKLYYCYTTCPRCAKAYGKNYVVLFAKVD